MLRTSIVIETWNAARDDPGNFARTLRALAAQDRAPDEAILVDGGAAMTEPLRRVADAEYPRARWVHAPGAGYYDQKNAGAAVATGEAIAFLDSDVAVRADWLRALLGTLEDRGEDVVTGSTRYEDAPLSRLFTLSVFAEFLVERPTRVQFFVANNCVFRTSVWREAGGFLPSYGRRGGCTRLASRLRGLGRRMLCAPGAMATHHFEGDVREMLSLQLQFGYATWKTRRDDLSLPGARAARLGPLAPFALTAARIARDFMRLPRARRTLGIETARLPAYAVGLVAARLVGMCGMIAGMLKRDYMERTLGW